jgi:hypothetical protein
MNEEQWLAAAAPLAMLEYLTDRTSARKLRQFACACARRWWPQLTQARARQAVELAERYADNGVPQAELQQAHEQAQMASMMAPAFDAQAYAVAVATVLDDAMEAARTAAEAGCRAARSQAAYECAPGEDEHAAVQAADTNEARAQAELLRHLIGNPFRPLTLSAGWLRSNDRAVAKIARIIYDGDRFEDLPYLADALQDAGCDEERLLVHCRALAAEDHPRGCWLLDFLLQQT